MPRKSSETEKNSYTRRKFCGHLLAGIVGFQFAKSSYAGTNFLEQMATVGNGNSIKFPTTWGINTNIDTWQRYAASSQQAIHNVGPLIIETGCTIIREGLQRNLEGNDNNDIKWHLWFDPLIEWLDKNEMQIIVQLNINEVYNPLGIFDEAWERRVTNKCLTAARYINSSEKRRKAVAWFLLINESDQPTSPQKLMSPEVLVRYHKLAWKAIKSVNPNFLIEGYSFADGAGAGEASPLKMFNIGTESEPKNHPGLASETILNLGGSKWCDFIGFHNYNRTQEESNLGARALVKAMENANEKYGYPLKPLVNSETGCHFHTLNSIGLKKGGVDLTNCPEREKWMAVAHWQQFNRLHQARWGISRSFYYSLGGSGAPWMNLVVYPMKKGDVNYEVNSKVPPYFKRPSFHTAVDALKPKSLVSLNGSFETSEDKFSNWFVCYNPLDFHSEDFEYGEWKETFFMNDGAHTAPESQGKGYLKLAKGLPKIVRRVVEGLKNKTTYQVTAWITQDAAAKSTLAVYGFNQNLPGVFVESSTEKVNEWVKLSVLFTTERSIAGVDNWGVISLEQTGEAVVYWDEIAIGAN